MSMEIKKLKEESGKREVKEGWHDGAFTAYA